MEELRELKTRMETQRPAEWEALPDLSLYMDQVIGYMSRQLIQYGEGAGLTSAMVNNYIKDGLLPRAEGKRYGRTHLAYLTAICALKQVLPVRDAGLLAAHGKDEEPREVYGRFREELDRAMGDTAGRLEECGEEDLPQLALSLALHSYANSLACERIMDLIREREPEKAGKTKKSKKEK